MSTVNKYGKNMKLFTSYWGDGTTFKMMPISTDCPYAEIIYDPKTTLLVVISKLKKNNLQMVDKLDTDGNPIKAKRPKMNNKPWAEKQLQIEVLQEYYITEKEEQEEFIKEFAVNAETFDFGKYLRDVEEESAKTIHVPKAAPILGADGQPLKAPKKKK